MDAELATLASTASVTLMNALATDGWEAVKSGIGELWRRVHPDRAETVEAELVDARTELLTARSAGDIATEQGLVEEWLRRFGRLLLADPEVAMALRSQMEDHWRPLLPSHEPQSPTSVTMQAKASGHGRTYQAGDHITIVGR